MMRYGGSRRKRAMVRWFLILCAAFTFISWLMLLTLRSVDAPPTTTMANGAMRDLPAQLELRELKRDGILSSAEAPKKAPAKSCATVEEMGKVFKGRILKESLRVRRIIHHHFSINGAPRIRELPPEQFCRHGFVIGKASEAGFGNEMYKLLTAAALSVMLNRSLIIGQTRGKYPFGDYILYSNLTFTLREVKHLWRQNGCVKEYGRHLVMRTDDFEKPAKTNALCGNWRKWRQPIIWSVRAAQAALNCLKRARRNSQQVSRPRVVVISDTPSFVRSITPNISEFAEVLHFDYKLFSGNVSYAIKTSPNLDFRVKDWGPAPRWVAFVDFFLASRAKHAVVSGAYRRVATTYAQLIAALAAANSIGENSTGSSFSFLSSFQGNLLAEGLKLQVGWGHVWNRFAGPLSCRGQSNQCAFTPLLPPAWWEGIWQSPIPRDIHRLEQYGVQLSGFGTTDENQLRSFCSSRKNIVKTVLYV
ncbi:uncharacterized protein LOC111316526 isoform X2 [Durio zibethinus]|uniref:Uncharacterized protein LOC111316526 isoform X2 n=1 Tax=Durio zibethinus TaxID=66656 RepID=A0A6P6BAV0_DURZI|nr:uncharacterized protein LOC111316526 isoform X2 [Durio zibethinus]